MIRSSQELLTCSIGWLSCSESHENAHREEIISRSELWNVGVRSEAVNARTAGLGFYDALNVFETTFWADAISGVLRNTTITNSLLSVGLHFYDAAITVAITPPSNTSSLAQFPEMQVMSIIVRLTLCRCPHCWTCHAVHLGERQASSFLS